jgi:AcrR family transcriptional regulator
MTEAPAAVPRGGRLSRSARRAQLLLAARDVFSAQGYHAAAMDDIAERAGVSKPVLYQHFPGKLELYRALLTTYADELVQRVRGALSTSGDNGDRVHASVAAYFDFVAGEGGAFRLIFESDLRSEPEAAGVVEQAQERCIDAIAEAVTTDAGIDWARARVLAVGLVGLSRLGAQHWLKSDRTVPRDEAVALLSALAWRGISGFPLVNGTGPDRPGVGDPVPGSGRRHRRQHPRAGHRPDLGEPAVDQRGQVDPADRATVGQGGAPHECDPPGRAGRRAVHLEPDIATGLPVVGDESGHGFRSAHPVRRVRAGRPEVDAEVGVEQFGGQREIAVPEPGPAGGEIGGGGALHGGHCSSCRGPGTSLGAVGDTVLSGFATGVARLTSAPAACACR